METEKTGHLSSLLSAEAGPFALVLGAEAIPLGVPVYVVVGCLPISSLARLALSLAYLSKLLVEALSRTGVFAWLACA